MNHTRNDHRTDRKSWRGMMPRSRSALIGIVLVAVVAFLLGGLFFGGGSSSDRSGGGDQDVAAGAASEPSVWTCSMHPQIQLPKPGKCPICFMDLIPVEQGGGEELAPNQLRMSETAKQLAKIETATVRRAFAEREVRMVGKIGYDETSVAYITAWVPGRLDRLYADYTGIKVNKGDHMVYMYSPELLAAQEELLQAKKAVTALTRTSSTVLKSTADATLDAARDKLRLYGLSDDQIAKIEASDKASDHLTINAPIGGVVVHKDAQEGMYVKTGTRIYTIADLSKLWVLFEAYESDLPWLRYGQHVEFRSPSFPGERFEAIVSFIDPVVDPVTRTVNIRAIVDNEHLKLKPDMFVRGTVTSRVDGRGDVIDENLAGKWIGPMHPEIVKDGPGPCDICGMPLVPAESLGYASRAVTDTDAPLLIPTTAPLITGKRAVVYVEIPTDEGPLFEGREVELGPRAGDFYVVKTGLSEGEAVVTNGAFKIDSELQIQAKPSMMSPQGGPAVTVHRHDGGAVPETETAPATYRFGTADRLTGSEEVRAALSPVYEAYFKTQMALASDDLDAARSASERLVGEVKQVDMSLFRDDAHDRWMNIMSGILNAAEDGLEASDIETARDAFFFLSNAIIELHDSFGHARGAAYYLTFCPMARNNQGAHWLQTVDTVYNSFYGEAMLRCGEIQQSLPSGDGTTE